EGERDRLRWLVTFPSSEDAAFRRARAAKLAREVPIVLEQIEANPRHLGEAAAPRQRVDSHPRRRDEATAPRQAAHRGSTSTGPPLDDYWSRGRAMHFRA